MSKIKENKERVSLTATSVEKLLTPKEVDPEVLAAELEKLSAVVDETSEAFELEEETRLEELDQEPEELAIRFPILRLQVSGLYANKLQKLPFPIRPEPLPISPVSLPIGPQPLPFMPPLRFYREELRLDVDGRYPQMMASGTITSLLQNIHWIAKLKRQGKSYIGNIWYVRDPSNSFRYHTVEITPLPSFYPSQKKARLTFSGEQISRSTVLSFQSTFYRPVELEYDCEEGITPETQINTHAHTNRPTTLPAEQLSIKKVFERAGFKVSMTGANNPIPNSAAGVNAKWSDNEMHDAMQTYWSRFANVPQWSLWVLFARQHDLGSGLGGIMFDSIGPNHRQGTAVFYDSFISQAPSGDSQSAAWISRMRFWTAVHEMGHAFNLAHSWQKELGNPWIPGLHNEPEVRSFMNYPYRVSGGQEAFFSDFDYRFSNQELLFMRHAPESFVQMGNANWFDNHGFEWMQLKQEQKLKLELRVHRPKQEFQFLEPIHVEFKLENISTFPQIVDQNKLSDLGELTLVIKREGDPAKIYYPFATYCRQPQHVVLNSGQAMYASHYISAGKKGWIISEPGYYTVQACMRGESGEDVVSNALRIRVAPARSYDENYVAQDYFSDEVARIYAFNGSRVLQKGIDTLQEVSSRLKDSRAAIHAQSVLAQPLMEPYKELMLKDVQPDQLVAASRMGATIKLQKAEPQEANRLLSKAFHLDDKSNVAAKVQQMEHSVETLGHIDATKQAERFKDLLVKEDKPRQAKEMLQSLKTVLEKRGVIKEVVDHIEKEARKLES